MKTQPKNHIHQIEIDHRKMFLDFCDISYDMIMEDLETHEGHLDIVLSFTEPDRMHKQFRCGNAPVIAGHLMGEIERMKDDEIPFVLIIRKNGDVWAVISCDEISF